MLADEFIKTGNWLFRWRSYLPLALLVLAVPAVADSTRRYGEHLLNPAWFWLALLVAFSGLAVRVLTVGYVPAGTSGRNTLRQVAATLNATGMYSLVRHPLYLGNFLMWFGLALLPRCWWFTAITVLIFWLYYERIMFAEEGFLLEQFGEPYRQWAARTPAFIPKFANWVKPDLPFSFKSVISREYATFFTIIAIFTGFQAIMGWFSRGVLLPDRSVTTLFVIGLSAYVMIRLIKKNTRLLRAEGR
ncbi:MAG: isoprenylcysteine carboxylmethyltransferase family protein [Desulfobaccales bacterium]